MYGIEIGKALFWGALGVCAYYDIKKYQIPNVTVLLALSGGFIHLLFLHSLLRKAFLAGFFIRALVILAVGYPLYKRNMTGGGDIKLAAVIMAVMGVEKGLTSVFTGLFFAAIWGLLKMWHLGTFRERVEYLINYVKEEIRERKQNLYYVPERDSKDCVIPLGACLCAGAGFVSYFFSQVSFMGFW